MTKAYLIALAAPTTLLAGCAHQSPLALESNQLETNTPNLIADSSTTNLPAYASTQILSELSMFSLAWPDVNPAPSIGPQLAAGDWLAWQCALAGSYWDIPLKNAPAYAEAFDAQ